MWKIAAIKDSKVYIGQTSNFSWDKPNLSSQVHEKFDVWLISLVWISLDRPTRFIRLFQKDWTSEDRLRDKPCRSSHATN